MKNFKVIFDNNVSIVGDNNRILDIISNNIFKLKNFIDKNNLKSRLTVCLTEVFKEEGIQELTNRVCDQQEKLKSNISLKNKTLNNIINIPEILPLKKVDIENKIRQEFEEKIKLNGIEIIPLSSTATISDFFYRSTRYNRPFEDDDKGFKDSLAYFSIIDDAVLNPNYGYILVTRDSVFRDNDLKNEFIKKTSRELTTTEEGPLEVVLDSLLELGLGLEIVKNEALSSFKSDEQLQARLVKKALEDVSTNNVANSSWLVMPVNNNDWESKVVNLIYNDVSLDIKKNISENTFEVEASVLFKPIYAKNDNNDESLNSFRRSPITSINWNNEISQINYNNTFTISNYLPRVLRKKFTLNYEKINHKFEITDSSRIFTDYILV